MKSRKHGHRKMQKSKHNSKSSKTSDTPKIKKQKLKSQNTEIQTSKHLEIKTSRTPKIQKSKDLESQKCLFEMVLVIFLVPETNIPTPDSKTVIHFFELL